MYRILSSFGKYLLNSGVYILMIYQSRYDGVYIVIKFKIKFKKLHNMQLLITIFNNN